MLPLECGAEIVRLRYTVLVNRGNWVWPRVRSKWQLLFCKYGNEASGSRKAGHFLTS
jgi:hypothetical protein